jgi:hypothetical protein
MPSPATDLGAQIPGLSNLNKTASGDILSKLTGTLSPGTLAALQNLSATYGATSGMPGSGLSSNMFLGNVAGAMENQEQQGLQDYSSFIPAVSGTQTVNPALQTQISGTNASNAAAPNPGASASYAAQMFNQYLNQMRGPGAGGDMAGNPAVDPLTGFPNWSDPNSNPYSSYNVNLPNSPAGAGVDTSGYAMAA